MNSVSPTTSEYSTHHHGEYRRRQRPWYKKLWRSVNNRGRVVRTALILFLVVAAVLLGAIIGHIDNAGLQRRRGMNQEHIAWSADYEMQTRVERYNVITFQQTYVELMSEV